MDGNNALVATPPTAVRSSGSGGGSGIFDPARFEHMQRVAKMMAFSTAIPDSLRVAKIKGEDGKVTEQEIPFDRILANCFMIVNQSDRWGMDPFAVAQCTSFVHGRLMYEGKLVAAVLEANLGVRLQYKFFGEDLPLKDRGLGVIVSGIIPGEIEPRTIEGTVADWHKGEKSPWNSPGAWKRQLRYMGAREWARAHAPAIMLGVITDDEADARFDRSDAPPQRQTFQERRKAAAVLVATDIPEEDVTATVVASGATSAATPETSPAADVKPTEEATADLFPADAAVIEDLEARLAKAKPADVAGIEKAMSQKLMSIGDEARAIALEIIQRAKQ